MGFLFGKRLYRFILTSLLILLASCSPQLSEYFDSTQYVTHFNTYIINDSLQLYLKSPADIHYERNKNTLKKYIKHQDRRFEGLLAHGQTEVPPHYELFLMLNPKQPFEAKNKNEFVLDTLIQNNELVLFCRNDAPNNFTSFRSDCSRIFNSISTNKSYRDDIASIFDLSQSTGNRYYQGLKTILDYPAKGRNEKSIQLQMALNFASFMAPTSVYDSLLSKFPSPPAQDSLKRVIKAHLIQGTDKIKDTLLHDAKKHRVVMFNENHFYPNHRKLLTKLLPDFRKAGFSHLALEALGEKQDSLLNAGQPPTIDTGFYTREPHFAELIRTGQKLGFTFVSYENTNPQKNREQAQADNLFSKALAKDKSARIIVLAGLDHILEQPTQSGRNWLAYILKEKYKIDPLTISQSHLNSYHQLGKPLALLPNKILNNYTLNSVDWLLLNNLSIADNNPNFEYSNSYNKRVQIAIFLKSEVGLANEFINKIPYRTSLVEPDEMIKYYLPTQEDYFIVILDENGDILKERNYQP